MFGHRRTKPRDIALRASAAARRCQVEPLEERRLLSAVVGRALFYNQSAFDGQNAELNQSDDAAIAPDKLAYRPGTTFKVSRLTNNAVVDENPRIYGDNVVWSGRGGSDGGQDDEIFWFDGLTTHQLTANSVSDRFPKMSALGIFWERGSGNTQEIIFFDGVNESPLTTNSVPDVNSALSDDRLVWEQGSGNGIEILSWNGAGSPINLSNNSVVDKFPSVFGNRVAWAKGSTPAMSIELWDNGGVAVPPIASSTLTLADAKVSDQLVAWEGFAGTTSNDREIYRFNGSTTERLTTNGFPDFDPQVSGGQTVWWGGTFNNFHIYLNDGVSTRQLSTGIRNQFPQISGNNVVWQGYDGHDNEIFLWDGQSVQQLTNNQADDTNPQIQGNLVVWQSQLGTEGTAQEIYRAVLGTAGGSSFANISSYTRGINGIAIDISGPAAGALTLDDFAFKVGNDNAPATWADAPPPTTMLLRAGAGTEGADRVEISWPNGAIKNTWLQVLVRGNDAAGNFNTNTGLATSDVFYFGSRVADAGSGTPVSAVTNLADDLAARNNTGAGAAITNLYDYDRNGAVQLADSLAARNNTGVTLKINLAAPPAAALAPPIAEPSTVASSAVAAPEPRSAPGAWLVARWRTLTQLIWGNEAEGEDVTWRW